MATPRDVEEEERRLDAKQRTATASTDAAGSPAVPPTALAAGTANAAAANAARTTARLSNLRGPQPPAPAAATTTSGPGREAAPGGTAAGAPEGAAVSAGDTPHLHHHTRVGGPQPWGVGGGIGAAPYRPDAPVFGLVGRDSDLLPSVLGPTDYAALIAGGLGDATTLIGGGGGMPLQSHQERMEERARAAARRAVNEAHAQAAADAAKKQKEDLAPAAGAGAADAPAPAKTAGAATEAPAGAAGNRPAHTHHHDHTHNNGHHHTHHTHTRDGNQAPADAANETPDAAVGDAKIKDPTKQQQASNDPRLAPPSPAACGRGHCSPGVAHDVGYEHDL